MQCICHDRLMKTEMQSHQGDENRDAIPPLRQTQASINNPPKIQFFHKTHISSIFFL